MLDSVHARLLCEVQALTSRTRKQYIVFHHRTQKRKCCNAGVLLTRNYVCFKSRWLIFNTTPHFSALERDHGFVIACE